MNRELLKLINSIKEKTGISMAVLSEDSSIDISTFDNYFPLSHEDFKKTKETSLDENENRTVFKFSFGGENFIGAIKGTSEISINYSTLIKEFLENYQVKNSGLSYDDEYYQIVIGNTTKSTTTHFIDKYGVSTSSCYAVIFKSAKGRAGEIKEFLKDYSFGESDNQFASDENTCIFIKFDDSDLDGDFKSSNEYIRSIVRSIYEELGLEVYAFVGGKVGGFSEIFLSYSQALVAERMNLSFGSKGQVSAYKDFILVKMAEDISKAKAEEFINAILDPSSREIIHDEELFTTGEEFINNNLNMSETARILHLHRNTLLYRLDKIEKITGLDLRKFNDALDFRIISVLKKLLG